MVIRFIVPILTVGTLLLVPFSASAARIIPLDDQRFIRAEFLPAPGLCADVTPSTPFEAFSGVAGCLAGDGQQLSFVGEDELGGTGNIFTAGGGFDSDVESRYAITFGVDEETPYVLDVDFQLLVLGGFEGGPTINPGTQVLARLTNITSGTILIEHDLPLVLSSGTVGIDGPTHFLDSGFLSPDDLYLLEVAQRSDRQISMTGSWNFSFVVPEPGTGLMLGVGLMLLSQRSGRKR